MLHGWHSWHVVVHVPLGRTAAPALAHQLHYSWLQRLASAGKGGSFPQFLSAWQRARCKSALLQHRPAGPCDFVKWLAWWVIAAIYVCASCCTSSCNVLAEALAVAAWSALHLSVGCGMARCLWLKGYVRPASCAA